jgi:hypothetical protein
MGKPAGGAGYPSGEGREEGDVCYLSYYQVSMPNFSYPFQFQVQEILSYLSSVPTEKKVIHSL